MLLAKLATAKTIEFGPVLDADGAEYTGAVVGDVKIMKNGAAEAALNGSATLTHSSCGVYRLALTAADISAVGEVTVFLSKTTYVAPPVKLNVMPANVYDSLVSGTDNLDVDAGADIAAIKAKTDNLPSDPADASDIATSFSSIAATLATIATYIDTEVAAIKAKTDNLPASPAAVGSAMTLTSGERDSIAAALLDLTNAIETGLTVRGALRLNAAALAGKLSGAATTTIAIRNAVQDSKARITATVDGDGNRTVVTTDTT